MMQRTLSILAVLLVAGCSSGEGSRNSRPVDRIFVEDERSPEKSAGWCHKCNMDVYQGHRCGLTAPCQLCAREAGARHLHEVAWQCGACDIVVAKQHECVDAKTCSTCRQDKNRNRTLLGTTGCERCFRQIPPSHLVGRRRAEHREAPPGWQRLSRGRRSRIRPRCLSRRSNPSTRKGA